MFQILKLAENITFMDAKKTVLLFLRSEVRRRHREFRVHKRVCYSAKFLLAFFFIAFALAF